MKTTTLAVALAALATAGCAFAQNEDAAPFAAAHEAHAAAHSDRMKQAEAALAASQKNVYVAQAGQAGGGAPKALTFTGVRKGSAGRALIIPKDPADSKGLAEAEEDMNVMAHILDKAASDDKKSGRAMGIPVYSRFGWGGGTSPQNLFIEGSGALFFLNVNYPLQAAPDKEGTTEAREKPVSEWDAAKKEMTAPRGGGADSFFAFGESIERALVWEGGSSAPYDAEKVEDLKNGLIASLKNAANIRKLKSDETVTVVVMGASALAGGKTTKGKPDDRAARLREEESAVAEGKAAERGQSAAKLVLRVKKSDTEAFQNGKLNLEDFKKKVTVMVY